ncbi:MAG: ATP-binding protein [Chloroflexota bacterium]
MTSPNLEITSAGTSAAPPAPPSTEQYTAVLRDYLSTHSEDALYRASLLSRACIEGGIGPEEIIALHGEAFAAGITGLSYREQARAGTDALAFLLEVMIAYGVQHREFVDVRLAAETARADAAVDREQGLADKATEVERTMTDHLAMIAHELRTPLTAALTSVDLVMRVLQKGEADRAPRYLGSAREALLRLSRLSGALLDASRRGPTELDRAPVEIPVILSQACTWAATLAEMKGIEIVRAGGPFSLRVLGDEDALLTVFGNLLANAIRYTSQGSVTVRYGARDAEAYVEIKDTGVGIPPEELTRIFEGFYRGASARHADAEGLGLGLTLAQRFAAAHAGRIEVESEVGVGSTFRVRLPLMTEAKERSEA